MNSTPNYSYTYEKLRNEFGRQCIFGPVDSELCKIEPDDELKKQFGRRKTAEINIQSVPLMAVNEVATADANLRNCGLLHSEGGWPSRIDVTDEEIKSQYRGKFVGSEQYKTQLKSMCMRMEHKIAQNNTCNLFEEYFAGEISSYQSYKPQIESISAFESPFKRRKFNEMASHSSIAPSSHDKMVVSYTTPSNGQMTINKYGMSSYIWDLNRNSQPLLELEYSESLALTTVEYNLKNEFNIAAGRSDGTVALYDSRTGGRTTLESIREESHRESVSSLQWTMSKMSVEFFTCANDANVMSWDIRNLDKPFEVYQLQLNGAGCSTADYTFTMPTRFLIGTTNGLIFNGNKREQTYEKRFSHKMKSFTGPVQSIERNPFADKYALSVGDQSICFWSDGNRETPILQTHEYSHDLTCGAWNRNRCSNFFIGHENGTIDMWDLLYDQFRPIASISMINSRVQHIRSHANGKLVIGCFQNGDVHLLQISDFLASHKIVEKARLIEILDRELRREVLFLGKLRELKMQVGPKGDDSMDTDADDVDLKKFDQKTLMKQCNEDFEKLTQKK